MRDYITLNGVRNTAIRGLMVQKLPPITKPPMRFSAEEIDGRDGDIVRKLGYAAYDRQVVIGLYGDYDLDGTIRFFNSSGTVVFSNEPHRYYKYEILGAIDFEKLVRFRQATVTFHCQPFKWSCVEKPVPVLSFCYPLSFKIFSAEVRSQNSRGETIGIWNAGTGEDQQTPYAQAMVNYQRIRSNYSGRASIGPIEFWEDAYATQIGTCPFRVGIEVRNSNHNIAGTATLTVEFNGSDQREFVVSDFNNHGTSFVDIPVDQGEYFIFKSITLACRAVTSGTARVKVIAIPVIDDRVRILNSGNIASWPDIRIEGTGTIGIQIANRLPVEVTLPPNTPITLKSEEMNALDDNGNYRNRCVDGDFRDLALQPGFNDVYIYGDATNVTFDKYSRWI